MPPLLLLLFLPQILASQYWDEYVQCRDEEGFGNSTVVCDPSHRLAETTRNKLSKMLAGLQDKIGCECADGCMRADGRDGFIGLLHATTNSSSPNLEEDVKREYADAHIGNASCDHGLILIYIKDTQKLASYRGGDSFVLLTDEDMEKLHTLAAKGQSESDALALQFLLTNYKEVVENPVRRSEAWVPMLGLVAAVLIVLIILGVLLAMFLAKFCCCCVKRKKDVYHVNTLPSYKTIEPLYVITPPTGHVNRAMSDGIYSTPYSGSPIPFPPPPGSGVPLTPSSSSRNRVNQETPIIKHRERAIHSEPGSLRRVGDSEMYGFRPEGGIPPSDISAPIPPHIYGTIPRATLSPRAPPSPKDIEDVNWLDPNRKQETQTKEELIY